MAARSKSNISGPVPHAGDFVGAKNARQHGWLLRVRDALIKPSAPTLDFFSSGFGPLRVGDKVKRYVERRQRRNHLLSQIKNVESKVLRLQFPLGL